MMEDQNKEQEQIQSEISEETVTESSENEEVAEQFENVDIMDETSNFEEVHKGKVSFGRSFMAILIDEVIIFVLSFISLYLLDFILRKAVGLYIVQKLSMLFILFIIVSVLYTSILEGTRGNTIGKKISNIKIDNA